MIETNNLKTVLIEYQCFGHIGFWAVLVNTPSVCFEHFERFQKSGFRNRYQLLGSNGVITLTVPVKGGRETKMLTSEVLVDQSRPWQAQHWKTLLSCYNKSPFFYHYQTSLSSLYSKRFVSLVEFDRAAILWVANALRLNLQVAESKAFVKQTNPLTWKDLRGTYKTGNRKNVVQSPYQQVFGQEFQQNLCILDLIFNLGPDSGSYLADFEQF